MCSAGSRASFTPNHKPFSGILANERLKELAGAGRGRANSFFGLDFPYKPGRGDKDRSGKRSAPLFTARPSRKLILGGNLRAGS